VQTKQSLVRQMNNVSLPVGDDTTPTFRTD
jgi:hypothetical protein